jgi:hypothetical protein
MVSPLNANDRRRLPGNSGWVLPLQGLGKIAEALGVQRTLHSGSDLQARPMIRPRRGAGRTAAIAMSSVRTMPPQAACHVYGSARRRGMRQSGGPAFGNVMQRRMQWTGVSSRRTVVLSERTAEGWWLYDDRLQSPHETEGNCRTVKGRPAMGSQAQGAWRSGNSTSRPSRADCRIARQTSSVDRAHAPSCSAGRPATTAAYSSSITS